MILQSMDGSLFIRTKPSTMFPSLPTQPHQQRPWCFCCTENMCASTCTYNKSWITCSVFGKNIGKCSNVQQSPAAILCTFHCKPCQIAKTRRMLIMMMRPMVEFNQVLMYVMPITSIWIQCLWNYIGTSAFADVGGYSFANASIDIWCLGIAIPLWPVSRYLTSLTLLFPTAGWYSTEMNG